MHGKFGLAAIAAIVVSAASCGVFEPDEGTDIARYFPLTEGNTWTYRTDGPSRTRRVEGTQDGLVVVRIGNTAPAPVEPPPEIEYFRFEDRAVMEVNGPHEMPVFEVPVLRAPIRSGASWRFSSKAGIFAGKRDVYYRSTIVDDDATVETPAGRFVNVAVVETREVTADGAPIPTSIVTTTTFAPGVGLVRSTVRDGESERVQELVAYDVR